jgi:hypothetical protein
MVRRKPLRTLLHTHIEMLHLRGGDRINGRNKTTKYRQPLKWTFNFNEISHQELRVNYHFPYHTQWELILFGWVDPTGNKPGK